MSRAEAQREDEPSPGKPAYLQQRREVDQAEVIVSQLCNFSLSERQNSGVEVTRTNSFTIRRVVMVDGRGGPRLEMHDVTFGFDPHVPHIVFRQQQQPLPGDVVFLEQVGIQLHPARHKLT